MHNLNNKKIAIYGGSFNPIHIGHLLLAEWTREQLKLDKIVFIPSLIPPHKLNNKITEAHHRFKMVELAIQQNAHFSVSNFEIEKNQISFSINTILYFREHFQISEKQLYFLIGCDSLIDFPKWRDPDTILNSCTVVVYRRPLYNIADAKAEYQKKVLLVDNPLIDLSSSFIRNRIQQGKSIRYMVPFGVERYINRNLLYKKKS